MNDLEHAQLAQKELEERAMREDELLRKCKKLTEEKKLTDEEHRIAYEQFTQIINEHKGQSNEVFRKGFGRF